MENFQSIIEKVGIAVDAAGVLVIVVGIIIASVRTAFPAQADAGVGRYTLYRHRIGRAILLGLEILVAADIIRTVAVEPTLQNLAVLAAIVAIRTFLSFSLELEISGRWPWQSKSNNS